MAEAINEVAAKHKVAIHRTGQDFHALIDSVSLILPKMLKSPGLGSSGEKLAEALHTGFNDITRIQNPADPAWRVVTSPKNAGNWHRHFTTNVFYAEGNSSVIVVRDSPIHFRIQRGNNNPTALVQSQLEISRSIADAAISVASTATGVPIPKPKAGAGTPDPANDSETPSATDSSVARKAAADETARVEAIAIRAFKAKLRSLREQLSALGPADQAKETQLMDSLQALLRAQAYLTQPPKQLN